MFFLALDDPDPDGKVDGWWEEWNEEYCHMKQVLYKKELTNFHLGLHDMEGDVKLEGDDEDESTEISGWHETHKNIMEQKKAAALEEHRKKEAEKQEAAMKIAEERRAAAIYERRTTQNDIKTFKADIERLKRKHANIGVKSRQTSIAIENLNITLQRDSRRIDRIKAADARYFKDFQRRLGSLESILKNQSGIAQFQRSTSLSPRSPSAFSLSRGRKSSPGPGSSSMK